MRSACLLVSLALTACAVDAGDPGLDPDTIAQDDEAETATVVDNKADAAAPFVGLWATHASTHKDGDITHLELQTGKLYVRARCYHTSCALPLPETDRYDVYTSSAGKTYVRFWSFTVSHDADGNLVQTPTVADVYEIAKTSTTIKLRKSYTTRWFSLYHTTATAQCTGSGGAWSTGACTCAGNVPGQWATHVFVAGAGGCIATPGADESKCDDSNGAWTDDDATLIDSYCTCGVGRYDDASGSCAKI
jgi:hypothetical protein